MSLGSSLSRDHPLILVVDDDASDRALIEHVLTKYGYTVLTIETCELALRVMETIVPIVIVVDVSLPGMSGFDLCSVLKSDDRLRSIPVVFLSGRDSPTDFQIGREVGGVFYLTKSAGMEYLLNVVRMLCAVRSARRPFPVNS